MCQSSRKDDDDVIRGDVLKLDFGKNAFGITEKKGAAPPSERKLPPAPGQIPSYTSIPGSADEIKGEGKKKDE
jgi:hypothetical protein